MIYHQTILPEAQDDFDEAVGWYTKEKKGLGKRFGKAVRQVLKSLRRTPKMHGVVVKDVRRAVVKDFPSYVVLYRVSGQEVIIISIFHTSQDPSKWQSRI